MVPLGWLGRLLRGTRLETRQVRTCGACGAKLLHVETSEGSIVPLDLDSREVRWAVAEVSYGTERPVAWRTATYRSHIETCEGRK